MLSKQMLYNLENSSAIRKMFIEGQEMAARVGAENVFDFSLGNPVAPVPESFTNALIDLIKSEDSLSLHGYMNNAGYPEVRQAVADHLNRLGIGVRAGLHCAPLAHRALGTLETGVVRASPGFFNTEGDIDRLLSAVWRISLEPEF